MNLPELAEARVIVRDFASAAQDPEDWSYSKIEGFLFAVGTAPDLIRPSEWLACMEVDEMWDLVDEPTARRAFTALMAMYNHVVEATAEGMTRTCCTVEIRSPAIANFDEDAPLHHWSCGFALGSVWLEDVWSGAVEDCDAEDADDAEAVFSRTLVTLAYFAVRAAADEMVAEVEDATVDALAEEVIHDFPEAMKFHAELGLALYQDRDDVPIPGDDLPYDAPDDPGGQVIAFPEPGRNAPCPCGSGKKYKRCCGAP